MRRPILYFLIGFPGVGKHSVATAMVANNASESRLLVVDNHYINNPIFGLLDVDGVKPVPPEAWGHVSVVRGAVLATIRSLSPPSWSFVMTNYLADHPVEQQSFNEIEGLAEARKSVFFPVILRCEEDEHLRRFTDRRRADRLKWRDPDGLRRVIDERGQLRPVHPNLMELDVTRLAPDEAGRAILQQGEVLSLAAC